MRWFALAVLAFALAACDDDDPGSCSCPVDLWVEQSLPVELVDGAVYDLDAASGRLVGLGVTSVGTWVIEHDGSDWAVVGDVPLPGTGLSLPLRSTIEPGRAGSALAVDGLGRIVVAGAAVAGPMPVVWFEGETGWEFETGQVVGFLQDVVAFGEGGFVAAGTGSSGFTDARGSAGGPLEFGTVAVSGAGETGLVSLVAEAGGVFGVGFDDGAQGTGDEPFRIVMHFDGNTWQRLESPCGPCASFDFLTIEATPQALYLGGSVMVRPAGDPSAPVEENAWMAVYSFQESGWSMFALPQPTRLERVNAILAASDGTVWVACGGFESNALLIRAAPGEDAEIDFEAEGLRLLALEETADGRILASGLETGSSQGWPVVLERRD